MLRSVTLGVVLSVLAAACALVEPPVPAGTVTVQGEVRNERGPVELGVTTPTGVVPDAVKPASLPADSTTQVTFFVPATGEWSITVDGSPDVTLGTPACRNGGTSARTFALAASWTSTCPPTEGLGTSVSLNDRGQSTWNTR